jgi:hypothetical protein
LQENKIKKKKKEVEIYLHNKLLAQVNSIKYLGIIFDDKMTFRDHVNHVEEKCTKLISALSKSAKVTWGLKHEAWKIIYTGGILPLILYGAPVWGSVLDNTFYKAKLIRVQRLINIRIANAYHTVSNEALCVITGLIPINIKIEESAKYYEIIKGHGQLLDQQMEVKHWTHPANSIKIIEGQEDSKHAIHIYTDSNKNEHGVGSGLAIFTGSNITDREKYRLDGRCSNNQAEQLAILKALENTQYLETNDRTVLLSTDR